MVNAIIVPLAPGGQSAWHTHQAPVFGFVLEGSARLACEGTYTLGPADAFVIPPDRPWGLTGMSPDFRLLHVTARA